MSFLTTSMMSMMFLVEGGKHFIFLQHVTWRRRRVALVDRDGRDRGRLLPAIVACCPLRAAALACPGKGET